MSDEPEGLRIKIKPIKQRPQKARLPVSPGKDYPANLLVVTVESSLLQKLRAYASSDLGYELGGVLVGTLGKASRRLFVQIENFVPATKGISRRASFEFTNEAQREIHEIVDAQYKHLKILGWFHTHPGYGIFLSSADQFIDDNYFSEKYHIAVVLDPTKSGVDVGAFVWDADHRRVRVPIFTLPNTETQ